jgi:hypothetical protein
LKELKEELPELLPEEEASKFTLLTLPAKSED